MSKDKFKRQNSTRKVKDSWRRPKGHHSSLRKGIKGAGKKPSPGYGSPDKGMHPSGYYEVLVRNPDDLDKIDQEKEAARISSRVGEKKKEKIREKAEEMDIKVLN
ncbi:MAG: 50S ribosomal protein L32e [Candidatus Aenigmatarchaeota archaeon]